MTDLVLATAYGYTFDAVEPFVSSLKSTGFDGKIAFLVGGKTDPTTLERFRAENIEAVRIFYPWRQIRNPMYKYWSRARAVLRFIHKPALQSAIAMSFQNISVLRYHYYRKYLAARPGCFRNVFLSDVRDVVFQDSPFRFVRPDKVSVYLEEPPLTLGTCHINSRWLRDGFGQETFDRLSSLPIACSGTILADSATMLTYLDAFAGLYDKVLSPYYIGLDQAMHNILVHEILKDRCVHFPNRESEILTMGRMPKDEGLYFDKENRITNSHGVPYAVLHQFDRHETLKPKALVRCGSGGGNN